MAGGGGRVVPGQLLHHAEVVEGPGSEGQVQHRGHVINKTRRQAVGHVTSHPEPPDTNLAAPRPKNGWYPASRYSQAR